MKSKNRRGKGKKFLFPIFLDRCKFANYSEGSPLSTEPKLWDDQQSKTLNSINNGRQTDFYNKHIIEKPLFKPLFHALDHISDTLREFIFRKPWSLSHKSHHYEEIIHHGERTKIQRLCRAERNKAENEEPETSKT